MKVYLDPTLLWIKVSGNSVENLVMATRPVQWAGINQSTDSCLMFSTVSGIVFKK